MDEPDQYSAASHEALKVATAALIEQIQQQVTAVGRMHGGSSEVLELFQGNETVARAAHEWAERFGDHTGTWPLVLANFDDDEDDEDDEETTSRSWCRARSVSSAGGIWTL